MKIFFDDIHTLVVSINLFTIYTQYMEQKTGLEIFTATNFRGYQVLRMAILFAIFCRAH